MTADTLPDPVAVGVPPLPFEPPIPPAPGPLSPQRKRTRRQRILLAAGIHPATRRPLLDRHAEDPLRCGGCVHLVRVTRGNRTFIKCENAVLGLSHSAASDVRVGWPACVEFEERRPDADAG